MFFKGMPRDALKNPSPSPTIEETLWIYFTLHHLAKASLKHRYVQYIGPSVPVFFGGTNSPGKPVAGAVFKATLESPAQIPERKHIMRLGCAFQRPRETIPRTP